MQHQRRRLAQIVPFIYGIFLQCLVIVPVAIFYCLPSTLETVSSTAVMKWIKEPEFQSQFLLLLSGLIGLVGVFVPSCLPILKCERDRRFYERLGISWFRKYANGGEMIGNVIAAIDPGSAAIPTRQFNLSTLAFHKAWYDLGERYHWGLLVGSIPAIIWAAALGQFGWVSLFCVTNFVINIYPIMLERYMRARVEVIERHPRYVANLKTLQLKVESL